jgi:3-hydroxyacyl-CoA dehydrogenase/acetyl-CoA acetyltransferase
MTIDLEGAPLLVVGAGIMGAGIAQVAAQAGHAVRLADTRPGAAADAKARIEGTFQTLVAKGRMGSDDASAALARIVPLSALDGLDDVGLVIEAIVEDLDLKRGLFQQIEPMVSPQCVLATNTSSISVTAIANGLQHPGRLVGMHFFNPVPLMKLVEVVSGLHTDAGVAEAVFARARAWGKVPVHARSTPGFIVNRIARPYYAETLALLLERAAAPQVLDACLRAAGFRMGPCELMDLIGHDTNFAVTQSVYEANFFDKRFQPSLVQREMVDGGLLGRKSGRGFYRYADGAGVPPLPVALHDAPSTAGEVAVHGSGHAFICDAIRTPFGRYGGACSSVRTDDLGAMPLKALMARNPGVDWAGRDRRDLRLRQPGRRGQPQRGAHGRLLAGLPDRGARRHHQPPVRLGPGRRGHGGARHQGRRSRQLMIAGGVESMSRAPFVMPKAESAFSRNNAVYDTTIGWRFVNKLMKEQYGVDSMPETAENVATDFGSSARRRTAWPWQPAQGRGRAEGGPWRRDRAGEHPAEEGRPHRRDQDEHPRETSLEALAKLKGVVRPDGTRDGRQRQRRERRRLRAAAGRRSHAGRHGLTPARPRGRHGHRRRGAAHHGHRPGAGHAKVLALTGLT